MDHQRRESEFYTVMAVTAPDKKTRGRISVFVVEKNDPSGSFGARLRVPPQAGAGCDQIVFELSNALLERVAALPQARVGLGEALVVCKEARASGLVSRVVEDGELNIKAMTAAVLLAQGPRKAIAETKRLMRATPHAHLEEHSSEEAHTIASLVGTSDGWEDIAAFRDKRPPWFGPSLLHPHDRTELPETALHPSTSDVPTAHRRRPGRSLCQG
ncbi:hypothetical protein [Saccharopolyspora sp. NPDC002376]